MRAYFSSLVIIQRISSRVRLISVFSDFRSLISSSISAGIDWLSLVSLYLFTAFTRACERFMFSILAIVSNLSRIAFSNLKDVDCFDVFSIALLSVQKYKSVIFSNKNLTMYLICNTVLKKGYK